LDGIPPGRRLVGALDGDALVVVRGGDGAALAAANGDGAALEVRPVACWDGPAAQPATAASMAAATAVVNAGCQGRRGCEEGISAFSYVPGRRGECAQSCGVWTYGR
jgi:hypothetical protein